MPRPENGFAKGRCTRLSRTFGWPRERSRSLIARSARDGGVGRHLGDQELEQAVDAMMWQPRYLPYEPA